MGFKHLFKARLNWYSMKKEDISKTQKRLKTHQIAIDVKEILTVSAAKAFKGDPSAYNPEDLLLSSVVSCQMMSYLYVCSQNRIDVISYEDNAEATLEVFENGSGRFVEIRLNPKVVILQQDSITEALSLHIKAKELCFIANSCNFKTVHFPSCTSATKFNILE